MGRIAIAIAPDDKPRISTGIILEILVTMSVNTSKTTVKRLIFGGDLSWWIWLGPKIAKLNGHQYILPV